jgi:hypothetical protein
MTSQAIEKRMATLVAKGQTANYKDHRSLHPHYNRWYSMVIRCENASHPTYRHYGARGIAVYSEWAKDPWSFFNYLDSELGPCPPKHSLDRIDVNGNYEPGNLRWASPQEQAANRRPRRLVKLVQSSSHVWAIQPWADAGVQPIWDA